MMIINQTELKRALIRALKGHSKGTQRALNNNDNNVNNIRSTDIKILKDAYVKNERLHQLIYNSITLKIRLFKLTLRGFLCFIIIMCL